MSQVAIAVAVADLLAIRCGREHGKVIESPATSG
jgi:hypothetical protein